MPELSEKETELVSKLKTQIFDIVKDEFSLMDSNLVRWIRMANGSVSKAEAAMRKHHLWRKENNAESLLTEKFCETVTESYYVTFKGHDKQFRPIVYVQLGGMDAQKLTNGNLLDEWCRYMWSITEKCLKEIKYNQDTLGLKECCGIEVVDLIGTTYNKCFTKQLFSHLLKNAQTLDNNYPDVLDVIIVINAPSFLDKLYRIVKFIMPQRVTRKVHIFGSDKSQWLPFLLEHISEDQLSTVC